MKESFAATRKGPVRLMIVGSDRIDAIENFYVKYLKLQGVDLSFLPAHTWFYEYYYRGLLNKLAFRAGISGIYRRINREFRKMVMEFQPSVIWIFKGMEIFPGSIEWAKARGIRLVNYNPDNPFLFTGRGSGNGNVTRSIGLYDLHFTYNLEIKKRLEDQFHARTSFLPFGYEIDNDMYEKCAGQEEVQNGCFLGNPDAQRAGFIKSLADKGISLDVYGSNWNKWLDHPNIRIFSGVYADEMWMVLRKYRVQLNLMRVHNEDSHNMRTFEVPAIGGIMLAPDTTEHRIFFTEGKEIFLFSDIETCVERMHMLLNLPAASADEIRRMARERSIAAGYSYKERARQAMEQIGALQP